MKRILLVLGALAALVYLLTRRRSVFDWPISGGASMGPWLEGKRGFGPRDNAALGFAAAAAFHQGLDFPVAVGTEVRAAAAGSVTLAYRSDSYGNRVAITHEGGRQTTYNHFRDLPLVKVGQRVEAGQLLGYSGATGWVTGPHLHFEVKDFAGGHETFYDPRAFLPGGAGPEGAASVRFFQQDGATVFDFTPAGGLA